MIKSIYLRHALICVALFLSGVLVVWTLFEGNAASQPPPPPPPSQVWFTCTSGGVAAFEERIHVRCTVPTADGISFFALGTGDPPHTARILSILSMAHVTGKPLLILYDPADTRGDEIGCAVNDCRLILAVEIQP
jgi:hypothetical protein